MNKETAQKFREVYEGLCAGKTIQIKPNDIFKWRDAEGEIAFDLSPECYRIKPEPREVYLAVRNDNGMIDRANWDTEQEAKAEIINPGYRVALFREVLE